VVMAQFPLLTGNRASIMIQLVLCEALTSPNLKAIKAAADALYSALSELATATGMMTELLTI